MVLATSVAFLRASIDIVVASSAVYVWPAETVSFKSWKNNNSIGVWQ